MGEPKDLRDQYRLIQNEFRRAVTYAAEYSDNSAATHFFRSRLALVDDMLCGLEDGRVLDCGCGPSVIATHLNLRNIHYYGLDISIDMLRQSMASFERRPPFFILGGIENLPFRDGTFDVVMCLGSFEYVLDSLSALGEIVRVVSTGGTVLISMHNPVSPCRWWKNHVWDRAKHLASLLRSPRSNGSDDADEPRVHSVIRSEGQMRQVCRAAGLDVIDVVYYDLNVLPAPLDSLVPGVARWLSEKLERFGRSTIRSLGTAYLLKCRKQVSCEARVDDRLGVHPASHQETRLRNGPTQPRQGVSTA